MQKNQIPKRKAAGFIRTNSSKALHTLKLPNNLQQSSDFSSFENNKNDQKYSDSQFSPYKNQVSVGSHRLAAYPPLPPPASTSTHNYINKSPKNIQPNKLFTNQKLIKNYQVNNYMPHNIAQSPNAGKIGNRRQEQIRQNLRKRAEVQKELKDIDRICNQIQIMKSPYLDKSKSKSITKQYQQNLHKSIQQQKINNIQKKQKPNLSKQKPNIPKYNYRNIHQQQQISFQSSSKNRQLYNQQNNNILNNPYSYSYSYNNNNNIKIQNYIQKQKEKETKNNINISNKNNYIKNNNQNLQQNSSQLSSQSFSSVQQKQLKNINKKQNKYQHFNHSELYHKQQPQQYQQQQSANFNYQQTFKPNTNEQILTTIQQYKKLHPPQNHNNNSNKSTNKYKKSQQNQQQKIKNQHIKAKYKFIDNQQHEQYSNQSNSQSQNQNYYGKQYQSKRQQQQLIQQYPKQQFKKTTIKQAISISTNTKQKQKQKGNQKQKCNQNNQGIYKAKGGISFNLDINQFTSLDNQKNKNKQYQIKYNNMNLNGGKKGKKVNTKQEILKRRQMAKNYDKIARAKVFGGF